MRAQLSPFGTYLKVWKNSVCMNLVDLWNILGSRTIGGNQKKIYESELLHVCNLMF